MSKTITGFSKLDKGDKIKWLVDTWLGGDGSVLPELEKYWIDDIDQQRILDGFSDCLLYTSPSPRDS